MQAADLTGRTADLTGRTAEPTGRTAEPTATRSRLVPRTAAGRRGARRLLWIVAGVAVAGAVANTVTWWSGTDLPVRDVVEGILSDVATGAGVALVVALLLYVLVWWLAQATLRTTRATMLRVASRWKPESITSRR